jgi:tetratricopeptide (TPR) repeat protein
MRERFRIPLMLLAILAISLGLTLPAAAQVGRIAGEVRDEAGKPIRGASVTAENPSAVPSKFTATTDNNGRFSMAGLKYGRWIVTVQASGFAPTQAESQLDSLGRNPPLNFKLARGAGGAPGMPNSEELQKELAAADAMVANRQYDEAIAAYRAIIHKVPQLTVINLSVANAYRMKKEYDEAIAAYQEVLKSDPNNERAVIGIGMTQLEKGDMAGAETTLLKAAEGAGASREVFYNLGEVKFAKGEAEEAGEWYEKAAAADPSWGKPVFKLGLVALNRGDRDGATAMMKKVMEVDPSSPEAVQAKMVIEQLSK